MEAMLLLSENGPTGDRHGNRVNLRNMELRGHSQMRPRANYWSLLSGSGAGNPPQQRHSGDKGRVWEGVDRGEARGLSE